MIRVLFVDDDPDVLDHLRHLLHRQEREWDMVFAPDPDCGSRRARPRARRRRRVRPAHAGHRRRRASWRWCATSTRGALASCSPARPIRTWRSRRCRSRISTSGKPCRTDQLVDVVNRTAGLYTHLDDSVLRGIVAGLTRLPTVPHVYLEITQAGGACRRHARRTRRLSSNATPRWWRRCCRWATRRGSAAAAVSRRSARRCSTSAPTSCAAWRSAARRSAP